MNKGVIYKVKFNAKNEKECFIKLERTVVIDGKEYNIYIEQSSLSATLFSVDTAFPADADLISLVDKKLDFEIENNKIISIEYEV